MTGDVEVTVDGVEGTADGDVVSGRGVVADAGEDEGLTRWSCEETRRVVHWKNSTYVTVSVVKPGAVDVEGPDGDRLDGGVDTVEEVG